MPSDISGRDPLVVVECCNIPDVTFHICNSDSCHFRLCVMIFPPWSGFVSCLVFCSCHAFHIMSSCALHLHTCSSHASEHFPRCPFCNPALLSPPVPPLVFFRVRVSNFLGMDRGLSSGPSILPVGHRSSFVPFGGRLVLQRLTGHPQSPFVCCRKPPSKPAQNPPNSLPCCRSFDHDRVGENRTSFGLS